MLRRSFLPVLLAMAATASAVAGELNPPAGPVVETGRFGPRTEINQVNTPGDADSLFKITAPGSYYLGGNILGAENKHGIEIASNGVTLDLMGFELFGVFNSLDGITVTLPNAVNVRVVNGSVRGWANDGVDLSLANNSLLRDIFAVSNTANGLTIGEGGVIQSCAAQSTGGNGIGNDKTFHANVSDCVAISNGLIGIDASGRISDCIARLNGDIGNLAGEGRTVITGCVVKENLGEAGIGMGDNTMVINCQVSANAFDGIRTKGQCSIVGNLCQGQPAGLGIWVDNQCYIERNFVEGNFVGIEAIDGRNMIIKNVARAIGTNYIVTGSNTAGPISTNAATAGPWANFVVLPL